MTRIEVDPAPLLKRSTRAPRGRRAHREAQHHILFSV